MKQRESERYHNFQKDSTMTKEQNAIEGTTEEIRGEWSDETLPVSRNKEREYPVDNS